MTATISPRTPTTIPIRSAVDSLLLSDPPLGCPEVDVSVGADELLVEEGGFVVFDEPV